MEIKGYKGFSKGLMNRHGEGIHFEVGKVMSVEGPLKFGPYDLGGNGYSFCSNLEDVFRYYSPREEEVEIAEVTAIGEVAEGYDDQNDYYDMYAARNLRVDRVLTREEIVEMGLNLPPTFKAPRFIQGFVLTPEEIKRFKERFKKEQNVLDFIAYYQEGDTEVFNRREAERNYPRPYQKVR